MAEARSEKVAQIDENDIISKLPRNIQEVILDSLPIRDAVRTSILSRKWRYGWTTIPQLLFSIKFARSMNELSHYDDPKFKAYEYVSVVNGVLLHHIGPVEKISFAFIDDFDMQIVSNYINQWIPLLSMKRVRQLTLEDWQGIPVKYNFFAHHFSCLELTHLRLCYVNFHSAPAFGGFAYLTNLELRHVVDYTQSIVACPVLEKLTLYLCQGLSYRNFHAPILKSLQQKGDQITLAGLENLTEFSFGFAKPMTPQTNTSNVIKIVGLLHKIEKFSVGDYCIKVIFRYHFTLFIVNEHGPSFSDSALFQKIVEKYLAAGGSPNRLSEPLLYLKNLNIAYVNFADVSELLCILSLIRSAPNLRALEISAISVNNAAEGTPENYRIEDSEDCTFSKLEIVTFSDLRGFRAEMELIRFLLVCSPSLKTMFIHRCLHLHIHLKLNAQKAVRIMEEMLQFRRVSPIAQIRHLKRPTNVEVNYYK